MEGQSKGVLRQAMEELNAMRSCEVRVHDMNNIFATVLLQIQPNIASALMAYDPFVLLGGFGGTTPCAQTPCWSVLAMPVPTVLEQEGVEDVCPCGWCS
jgi:hypothetical protein